MTDPSTTRVTFTPNSPDYPNLYDRLRALAFVRRVKMTAIIREALDLYLQIAEEEARGNND